MAATLESPLLANKAAAAGGGSAYQIANSLRFNKDDSPSLARTIVIKGNRRTWTLSGWVKRGDISRAQRIFSSGVDGNNYTHIELKSSDEIFIQVVQGNSNVCQATSSNKFRDTTAWFHLVVAIDTNQLIASDRVKVFVNGESLSLTYATTPAQSLETETLEAGSPHKFAQNGYSTDGQFNGYLADLHLIDGLQLYPAAFGEFDSDTGAWNPKAFALPSPNKGVTHSSTLTSSSGWNYGAPADAFDGVATSAKSINPSDGHTATWKPATEIKGQIFEIHCKVEDQSATDHLTVNGVSYFTDVYDQLGNNTFGWATLNGLRSINTTQGLTFKRTDGNKQCAVSAIRVDGKILINGQTDPTARNNPNDGTKWSDGTITGGAYQGNAGNAWVSGFNGALANDSNNEVESNSNDPAYKIVLPESVPFSTGVSVYIRSDSDNPNSTFKVNNVDQTGNIPDGTTLASGVVKVNCTGISSPLTSVEVGLTSGSTFVGLQGIEVDGHVLLDEAVDNSFHLKLSDTSLNRYLGKDTLTTIPKTGAAPSGEGAYPIYNTNDNYGKEKGSGNRTDSDSSNLKLAIAGDAFTDSSGNSVNVSATNATISTTESRFYGSSIKFDGTGDYITTGTGLWSANGDATFEAWLWIDNFSDNHTIMHTADAASGDSSSDICIMTDKQIRLHPTSANAMDTASVVPLKTWFHLAVVQSSNTRKVYINGVNQTLTTVAGNANTAAWNEATETMYIGEQNMRNAFDGYMQDIRVYDKQRYTSSFKPPVRQDFDAANFTGASSELEVQPSKQFNTLLYSGNSSNGHAITGLGFKPDLVWIKCRSSGKWPALADSVRGGGKIFNPNDYSAEQSGDHIKSFDDDGFTVDHVDTGTTNGAFDYVAWCWKAGGTASSNSDGSITTSVSVNPNNTFSIIKYTGTGSNATLGHGLNKAPKMFIIKSIDDSDHFYVYHYEAGANKYLALDQYDGSQTSTTIWQNDHPSDSVIKIGGINAVNESGDDYICYAFAEQDGLCAIGKYTGNGSNSGPTVNVGFKPAWITVKNSESDGATPSWLMVDSVRGTDKRLWNNFGGNSGDTESTQASYTFSNTGFTITDDGSHFNGNNKEYYYLTFAQDSSTGVYGSENIDVLTDSPTNYGEDTGAGGEVRGNYASWNPLTWKLPANAVKLLQGNLYAEGSGWASIESTHFVNSGKWYFEVNVTKTAYGSGNGHAYHGIGVVKSDYDAAAGNPSSTTKGWWFGDNGWYKFGTGSATNGNAKWEKGDVIGIAIDCSAQKVTFYRNNSQVATQSSLWTAGDFVGPASMTFSDEYGTFHLNTGQRAFKYSAPADHTCICTANFSDTFSAEDAGTVNNPSKYFDILTYTGTGSTTQNVLGLGFQPELAWVKKRSIVGTHNLFDAVRGNTKRIFSDLDQAENTNANIFDFKSNGIEVTESGSSDTNDEDKNMIAWCWDAGTESTSTNSSGSNNATIECDYRVNTTSGFSIAKYTGTDNGSGTNNIEYVYHGLNAAPDLVIIKNLSSAKDWITKHTGNSTNKNNLFNLNNSENTWGDGYIGDLDGTNADKIVQLKQNGSDTPNNVMGTGNDYIMYSWTAISGYSAFGAYEGINSTTGPFVYTGMTPKWLLIKNIDNSAHWQLIENATDTTNPISNGWYTNLNNSVETNAAFDVDFLANGFTIRNQNSTMNTNGETYIYAAFAAHPFKLARAK